MSPFAGFSAVSALPLLAALAGVVSAAFSYTVTVQSSTGGYLGASGDPSNGLVATASAPVVLVLLDANGGALNHGDLVNIQLEGQYLSSNNGGGGSVAFTAPWARGWENFIILNANGASGAIANGAAIALQAASGGQYLSAINGGGDVVTATAPWIKGWETLTLGLLTTNQYISLSSSTGQYLDSNTASGNVLSAQSATPQTFILTDLNGGTLNSGDTVNIKFNGQWLSASNGGGGSVAFTAPWAKAWEDFIILNANGASGAIVNGAAIALQSVSGGQYLSAINGGGDVVTATAPWIKGWETLTLNLLNAPAVSAADTAKSQVLNYISSISGSRTVAGQHNKNNPTPTDGTDAVYAITGKMPGLWSADFGFGSSGVDYRQTMINQLITQWNKGDIVQLMYHNCIPTSDEYCSWDEIGGSDPQHLTDDQWSELISTGTALNSAWLARLDTLSVFFAQLQGAGIAPLFRPLHEMNQGVFWWGGRSGSSGTLRLFQITHDYLVNVKGFTNIIWVWDVQDFSTLTDDVSSYYPGDFFYDIAALDVYDGGYDQWKYDAMLGAAGSKPIAIGECSTPPTSSLLASQPNWVFFMLWPDYIQQNAGNLPALYSASNVITESQLPTWI